MSKNDGWLKREIDSFIDAFKDLVKKEPAKKEAAPSTDQIDNNQKLINELKALEEKFKERNMIPQPDYDSMFKETLGLEPKEVPFISDEDIAKQAEQALLPDYIKKVDNTELGAKKSLDALEDKVTSANIKYNEDMHKLNTSFNDFLLGQERAMIRQGIIHSSISSEGAKDIHEDKERALMERNEKFEATIAIYDKQIEQVELSRVQALREYELKFAADLEVQMAKLRKERDNLVAAINTYNANIIREEQRYQENRQKSILALEEERLKAQAQKDKAEAERELITGYTGAKAEEMMERYNMAINFYDQLPKDVALSLISENEAVLKSALGHYYGELIAKQRGRKD